MGIQLNFCGGFLNLNSARGGYANPLSVVFFDRRNENISIFKYQVCCTYNCCLKKMKYRGFYYTWLMAKHSKIDVLGLKLLISEIENSIDCYVSERSDSGKYRSSFCRMDGKCLWEDIESGSKLLVIATRLNRILLSFLCFIGKWTVDKWRIIGLLQHVPSYWFITWHW